MYRSTSEPSGKGNGSHSKWSFLQIVFQCLRSASAKLPSKPAYSDSPGQGLRPNPAPKPSFSSTFWKPADEAGGRTEARQPPRPLSLRVWLQPPGQDRAGGAEPGRQRGRGRPPRFEHRSSRSTAAGTGRVVTARKRRAVRSSPGLPLTSLRRPTSAVAGPLLLPPLLLTSTSLCRKVDPAPRPTHTQRRKRSSEVWDQASGEGKEEGGGEG